MMDIFTTILGALGGGGLTGLLGGALSFLRDRATMKLELERMRLDHQHELAMADKEREMMLMEAEKEIRISEVEASAIEAKAHYEAMTAGYSHAKLDVGKASEGPVLRFVEGLRRLVRPFASYYAMAVLTLITVWTIQIWEEMGLTMTQAQAYELSMQMLAAMIYISSTIILWWFSTRGAKISLGK